MFVFFSFILCFCFGTLSLKEKMCISETGVESSEKERLSASSGESEPGLSERGHPGVLMLRLDALSPHPRPLTLPFYSLAFLLILKLPPYSTPFPGGFRNPCGEGMLFLVH